MHLGQRKYIGVDLFAGAGGLSLGASMAGIDVCLAIEKDPHAAATYIHNHPETKMLIDDIKNIDNIVASSNGGCTILFGGPPCQGFSTSNQRTRSKDNPTNWLFKEFIRIACIWRPDWIVFENVRGISETEKGLFKNSLISEMENMGYTCSSFILCASDFGVPQVRSRFFLLASRKGVKVLPPKKMSSSVISVREALYDLPNLSCCSHNGYIKYSHDPLSEFAKMMRGDLYECNGHLLTKNAPHIIERYKYIPQGGNWENIPGCLMTNYTDRTRCHTGIYRRLDENLPSVVLGNYRKNMLIHPWEDRGLSVREAARLQSFPDWYEFQGSIGFQQQQVGNAVPPLLAKSVFETILHLEDNKQ